MRMKHAGAIFAAAALAVTPGWGTVAAQRGILPPAIISARGAGRSGSSSISVTPGTQTTGVAHADEHTVHVADTGTSSQLDAAAPPSSCGDFPTWYDAQL